MKSWNVNKQASRGSTLIVALVFLLILTLAGVTAMRFSSMEEAMAGNSQSRNYVFQQATSEIYWHLNAFYNENNLAARNQLRFAQEKTGNISEEDKRTLPDSAKLFIEIDSKLKDITAKNRLTYLSDAPCEDGSSIESFVCIKYEIDVTARTDNGASSQQIQGFVFQNNKGS